MPRFLLLLLLLLALPVRARADEFTTSVRPILARACFKCHGPDDKARKAKLRLDVREEALKPARSRKHAIVPGKPAESELITRVTSADDTEVMPPPSSKITLTPDEKRVLRQWIADGAAYTPHWAFLRVARPAPPRLQLNATTLAQVRNSIDLFVLARLEAMGVQLAPEASRHVLVRRLYLDLIGVPPTPEEADAFVNDPRPDAYERLVEALLSSPRYGERWARRWLDLARYADTNGYEKDRLRSIWPWRDWVIAALNADLPFDQFTIEQLAGDMLPNATLAQRIATGFHRNTMLNEEGGIDPLEFRFHAMTDRVATTGTVWLGLTLGCAQCHTHKYDPISHREYYRFFAFLNNADEPELEVTDAAMLARRRDFAARIRDAESRLAEQFPGGAAALEQRFTAWTTDQAKNTNRWQLIRPTTATANVPKLTVLPDASSLASGDTSKRDVYELTLPTEAKNITGLRLEVLPDSSLPKNGPGRVYYEGAQGDFFLSEVSLLADGAKTKWDKATQSFANGAQTAARAIDGDLQSGWSINGGQGKAHNAVFTLTAPLASPGELKLTLICERYHAAGLGRFRVWVTSDAKPTARDLPSDLEPILLLAPEKRTAEQTARLRQHFLLTAPELAKARAPIDAMRKQASSAPTTLVLSERPSDNPRPTFLHHRGEFLEPEERVHADVPAMLHAFPRDLPRNRLGFARWLMLPENPLTARVTVNREWSAFFGRGLVTTVQDFGLQGDAPSHPELLDWLADEFIQQGWSLKRLHRLIVTSGTYRQSSASRLGPAGTLPLARGPRVRLEAEMVRDAVLRSSGLLSEKLGGPSVFPPQPPGVTTEGTYGALKWEVSPGLDRYRRGLYTFSKRTAPYALFNTFDAPSGEFCQAKREVSNTALQALMMLNDQTILEAAQELGRKMTADKRPLTDRIQRLFRVVLTRPPTEAEAKMLQTFWQAQHDRLTDQRARAATLAGPGEGDVIERAAWTALARVLFNLDELITRG